MKAHDITKLKVDRSITTAEHVVDGVKCIDFFLNLPTITVRSSGSKWSKRRQMQEAKRYFATTLWALVEQLNGK